MTVDIVVPYWGDPRYLDELVASVRAQTSPDWRLTVVDDCYPDLTTGDRLAALADDRIGYLRHETNLGLVANFRACVAAATNDVVVLPGCDDLLRPRYVEAILAGLAAHPEADIVQPGVEVVDVSGRPHRPLADRVKAALATTTGRGDRVLAGERLAASLLTGDWLYWPSLAFRRERLQSVDFRDDLPVALDLALLLEVVVGGARLLVLDETAFAYRRHAGSESSTALLDGDRFPDERAYFRGMTHELRQVGWTRAACAARVHLTSRLHAVTLLPQAARRGDARAAAALLRHAVAP